MQQRHSINNNEGDTQQIGRRDRHASHTDKRAHCPSLSLLHAPPIPIPNILVQRQGRNVPHTRFLPPVLFLCRCSASSRRSFLFSFSLVHHTILVSVQLQLLALLTDLFHSSSFAVSLPFPPLPFPFFSVFDPASCRRSFLPRPLLSSLVSAAAVNSPLCFASFLPPFLLGLLFVVPPRSFSCCFPISPHLTCLCCAVSIAVCRLRT